MKLLKIIKIGIPFRKYSADSMVRAWESQKIIPEVIPKMPLESLKLQYKDIEVSHGTEVKPRQTRSPPTTVSWTSRSSLYYTLAFLDPDAPSRSKPTFREWQHWTVVNIPGTRIDQGEVLAQYIGAGPPQGTGKHRYIMLVYEQPQQINFENAPRMSNTSVKGRPYFSVAKFAERYSLGFPIAGNFFLAEWDDYVPELYKQIGLSGF